MFKKALLYSVMIGLMLNNPAFAQKKVIELTPRQAISNYAQRGNVEKLKELTQKYNIDLTDADGNTALCESILKNDKKAFKILLELGADKNATCIENIPEEIINSLEQTTATSVSSQETKGIPLAGEKSGTFLGMGALGWGITGTVVAGGVIAAAAGGGGGGGGGAPVQKGEAIIYSTDYMNNSILDYTNSEYRDVYGILANQIINGHSSGTMPGSVTITNNSNGDVYALYGKHTGVTNGYGDTFGGYGYVTVNNNGNGNVFGIYTAEKTTYNAYKNAEGKITISNSGNGNIFGIYSSANPSNYYTYNGFSDGGDVTASIKITNLGNGEAFGIYSLATTFNGYVTSLANRSKGTIDMYNLGEGIAYGMYSPKYGAYRDIYNGRVSTIDAKINMYNAKDGIVSAMNGGRLHNHGNITISNLGNGIAVGMRGNAPINGISDSNLIINKGNITINRNAFDSYTPSSARGGLAVGIYAGRNSTVINDGNITIDGATLGYGIYAKGVGGSIANKGIISVNADDAYGIYIEQGTDAPYSNTTVNTTVTNSGSIIINGSSCPTCSGSITQDIGHYIVLNGATLMNGGEITIRSMNLNSINGTIIATSNAKFNVTEKMSGTLGLSTDLITNGFNTTYRIYRLGALQTACKDAAQDDHHS